MTMSKMHKLLHHTATHWPYAIYARGVLLVHPVV